MLISRSSKKAVIITGGDPSGIGPEIILEALGKIKTYRKFVPVIIGDYEVFLKTARATGARFPVGADFIDLKTMPAKKLRFGQSSSLCGRASMEYLALALSILKKCPGSSLVTAPISKASINMAGFKFAGHTEFLSECAESKNVTMMLVSEVMKVSLVTRHVPLKEVARHVTRNSVMTAVRNTNFALKKLFGIKKPRIGVAGLNPHAGESGFLGKEDASVIIPALACVRRGLAGVIEGPLPADTLFYKAKNGEFDAVVAMYHDQGLGPFKMIEFKKGVNLTLGLPFIRTSPDHGTGFDIAGTGKADPSSMVEAIKLAARLSLVSC